ncbi:MAG: hypothetical protein WCP57_10595 [Bacteroidota bacterium]
MKKLIVFALSIGSMLQIYASAPNYIRQRTTTTSSNSFKTTVADCEIGNSQFDLDINNIRTKILARGDMWWDLSNARYEVPKIDPPGSAPSVHALFAGAIWISGEDDGGNLKIAAQTYSSNGNDYFPGPLTNTGQTDNATCKVWDKHFNVYGDEIRTYLKNFGAGPSIGTSNIPANVLKWPGSRNPYLLESGLYYNGQLAPFFDYDDDCNYDPTKGDYPALFYSANRECATANNLKDSFSTNACLEPTFADQMIFWVFNDVGNIHTQSQGDAIGLQINALAFAFRTSDELNNMTFYRYNIINRSNSTLNNTYMGQWVDPDLGCYDNDYVGCDVARGLGIVYNGEITDPNCQSRGYGSEVPLLGIDYFEGPRADLRNGLDDDGDGLIDEGTDGIDNDANGLTDSNDPKEQELLGMSSFVYFNNAAGAQGDPQNASQFRNYMTGKWSDGTPITLNGTGYGGSTPTSYVYPGDPSVATQWSECNNQTSGANVTADRRFAQFSGPFTLKPGDQNNITIGVIFVRPKVGAYPCPSFSRYIGVADDKAQALFDNCFKVIRGPDAPTVLLRELDKQIILNLVNTGGNNIAESYDEIDALIVNQDPRNVADHTYTFQGYKIYQLKDGTVSTSDLNDNAKARIVSQIDIKDGISTIINFTFDAASGTNVPTVMVEGANKGLTKSFNVTSDLFADGDNRLINHKTYYFTALAYAHNDFTIIDTVSWVIDTASSIILPVTETKTQDKKYLQGNGNLSIYTAIPHIVNGNNEGTVINSKWGDSISVVRLQGQGNGGNNLSLETNTIDRILTTYATDSIRYLPGMGPVFVKVVDPLRVQEADYKIILLESYDSIDRATGIYRNSATWILLNLTSGDTVYAEKKLGDMNEQIIYYKPNGSVFDIEQWGIAVVIGQSQPVYSGKSDYIGTGYSMGAVYGALTSTISFQNPEQNWLSFIQDVDGNERENWLRCGDFIAGGTPAPATAKIYDDAYRIQSGNWFYDPKSYFERMADGLVGPYCLAANNFDPTKTPTRAAPDAIPYIESPGFKWNRVDQNLSSQNNLDELASVMLVLTPDKSKWSRCIVFETGEQHQLNQDGLMSRVGPDYPIGTASKNSYKGEIRSYYSVDKDGNLEVGTDTGRSWFPGYAINMETGERLNMAFGEASNLAAQNGRDMIWNPTGDLYTDLNQALFGGKHYIYVFKTKYDEGASYQRTLLDNFNLYTSPPSTRPNVPVAYRQVYKDIIYCAMPYITKGFKLKSIQEGLIPNEVTIQIRADKPYKRQYTGLANDVADTASVYFFSTRGMAPIERDAPTAKSALELINVVPNPYYAYGGFYETSPIDTRIKIVNLPNKCTVSIYTIDGTLVKKYERDVPVEHGNITNSDGSQSTQIDISDGEKRNDSRPNLENSVEWDLKNFKNIPISSGVYIIHINAPGIGERTLKWFGVMRPTDLDSF